VLKNGIDLRLKELLNEKQEEYNYIILGMEVMPDHVHLLLDINPKSGIYPILSKIKGYTSHTLREEFPILKKKLPCLWTNSNFISTCGSISLETVKRYIEDQLIPNNKLNDLKSKYLPDWEMLDHRILQAKYVAKDHRHAEEFVSYINKVSEDMDHFAEVTQDVAEVAVKTSTFDVKGLTILDFKLALKVDKYADANDIEQVRMQGNFGMHESNHGRYYCSTDKKWKTRKGPKQKRSV
jgi:putative transposase